MFLGMRVRIPIFLFEVSIFCSLNQGHNDKNCNVENTVNLS